MLHMGQNTALAATGDMPHREHRRRTLIAAKVRYGGSVTVEVLVRDITTGGAKLKVQQDLPVPDAFELQVDGMRADCTVAWRRGAEIGLRFDEPLAASPLTGQRVKVLTGAKPSLRRTG